MCRDRSAPIWWDTATDLYLDRRYLICKERWCFGDYGWATSHGVIVVEELNIDMVNEIRKL